ncbi:hypothetical protein KIPB_010188 [Kipferlia bialata]|uniref:Uncharacterized protein n=1 Tax=Kipferlia bialata TaxID=797122 RepID=A0A391NYG0_9EUKA|nr:hypothetical protein KIPB_010188 [Kipferlia bialata]|eukprot:g10188.t1
MIECDTVDIPGDALQGTGAAPCVLNGVLYYIGSVPNNIGSTVGALTLDTYEPVAVPHFPPTPADLAIFAVDGYVVVLQALPGNRTGTLAFSPERPGLGWVSRGVFCSLLDDKIVTVCGSTAYAFFRSRLCGFTLREGWKYCQNGRMLYSFIFGHTQTHVIAVTAIVDAERFHGIGISAYDTVSEQWQRWGPVPNTMGFFCVNLFLPSMTLALMCPDDTTTLCYTDPAYVYPDCNMGWACM